MRAGTSGPASRARGPWQGLLLAGLLLFPLTAGAMVCRAPPLILRITLEDKTCRIGDNFAIRRETPKGTECLLSNPQLRIITLMPDGSFTYDDTDNDTFRTGICTAD